MMEGGKKGKKVLSLGARLKYPIKITRFYRKPGDQIKQEEPVLQYSFKWWVDKMNDERDMVPTEETSLTDWNAPSDGQLVTWHLQEGDEIFGDQPCITLEESCTHDVQFQGMCAMCGKDMNTFSWANEHRDTERAPINMTHDQTSLLVSQAAAAKAEKDLQRRLIEQRKLSLVVDLDQTIIHACCEPTVGEWQADPSSPNHDAVKDVKKFQLHDENPRGIARWYYIKLRPGLLQFLHRVAKLYELHVYTMGTRAYAENIAKIVDPDRKLFANRVISRDENGNMTAKSLQRLFPVSTNMVVIIDDRADVWPRNRPNLIKVVPYDFFKGIGDINSSFLPKREDLLNAPATPPEDITPPSLATNGNVNGGAKVSALEELAKMSGGEDTALLKQQTEEQERSLEQQIKERPLLHLQEQMDKEDEKATQQTETNGEEDASPEAPQRHHVLLDDDEELTHLERHLTDLHGSFYRTFDAKTESDGVPTDSSDIPDVGKVMDDLKAQVLRGTTIVLSGLVPIGVDILRSEIGLQAQSFGAQIKTKVTKVVSHLVISSDRPRTQKVRQAGKIPSIKIVNQNWLSDSLSQWRCLDETPYLVDLHPADRAQPVPAATSNEVTDTETISNADAVELPKLEKTKLKIVLPSQPSNGNDHDADESAEEEGDEHVDYEDIQFDDFNDKSPIDTLKTFDWEAVDDELAEFLADDTDDETDRESIDLTASPSTKRKHDSDGDSDTGDPESGGILTKKQRFTASNLRVVQTPDEETTSASLNDSEKPKRDEYQDTDDDDDGLEADLLAELEAEEALESEKTENGEKGEKGEKDEKG